VTGAGRVLDEDYVTAAKAPLLSGGHLDLDLAVEQNDELAPRCAVPVVVIVRASLAEDDTGDRVRFVPS